MSEIYVTINPGTEDECVLTMKQVILIDHLGEELGKYEWHVNECGRCVSVHPAGQHDRGYVIDAAGGYEWYGPPPLRLVWGQLSV